MRWLKKKENRPAIAAAVFAGALSVLASLLGKAYLKQRDLKQEATEAASQAEAAAATARQEANKGERAREQAQDLVGYIMRDLREELVPIGRADVLESVSKQTLVYFENLPPDLVTSETEEQLAAVWKGLGHARYRLGNLEGAVEADHKAIALLEKLVLIDPGDQDRLQRLGHARIGMAQVLSSAGKYDKSRAEFFKVLKEQKEIHILAEAEAGLAEVENLTGNNEGALQRNAKAIRLIKNALDDAPGNIAFRKMLTIMHGNAGLVASEMEMEKEAEASYRAALESARKLIALDPDNRNWEKELATLLNNFGILFEKRGDFEQAAPFFNEALSLREGLVAWDPSNTRWLLNLANSWHNDAAIHYHRNDAIKTLASAQKALGIYQQLLTIEPKNTFWLEEMQEVFGIQKERLLELRNTEGMLTMSAETTEFLEKLHTGNRENFAITKALAGLHREVGKIKEESGGDVVGQYSKAAEAFAEEVVEADDEKLILLVQSYLDLAQAMEKKEDAARCFALAHFVMTKLVKLNSPRTKRLKDFAWREAILSSQKLQPLVAAGATWKYWDKRETPPEEWTTLGFDDTGWLEGQAPLGYGNGNEATEIRYGSHAQNKRLTAWFRHEFEARESQSIFVNLRRDDGAIVYLNGVEIFRDGMPEGSLSPSTVANHTAKGFDERVFHSWQIAKPDLKAGKNTIAVEIHQNEPQSSDLCMDLEIWVKKNLPKSRDLLALGELEELLGEKAIPEVVKASLR